MRSGLKRNRGGVLGGKAGATAGAVAKGKAVGKAGALTVAKPPLRARMRGGMDGTVDVRKAALRELLALRPTRTPPHIRRAIRLCRARLESGEAGEALRAGLTVEQLISALSRISGIVG